MEEQELLPVLVTCGICENIMGREDIKLHPCIKDYGNIFLDKNNFFYPMSNNGDYISGSLTDEVQFVEDQENICPNKGVSKMRCNKGGKKRKMLSSDEEVEELIGEVQRREPLWNYTLGYQSRKAGDVEKLWDEVAGSDGLKGKISGKEAKLKFKSLKDTYRKIIQAELQPSGSARKNPEHHWKFYTLMSFTKGHLLNDETASNISVEEPHIGLHREESNSSFGNSNFLAKTPEKRRTGTRRDSGSEIAGALMRLAESYEKSESIVIPPPPIPKQDDIDGMLIVVGSYLRQLPDVPRMNATMEILNLAHRKLQEYQENTPKK